MCANSTTLNRQRTLMRSFSMLRTATPRRLSLVCGNAGSKPAASLVGVALMLSLVQRAPEPQPQFDFAPTAKPAAPLARKQAPEVLSAPAGAMSAPAPMAEMAAPMQSESIHADEAKASKRAAAPANGLDERLREVLRLRESGQSQAADTLFNDLHKRYPNADLDARLKQIQKN